MKNLFKRIGKWLHDNYKIFEHTRLVASNRRRKRAECALKKTRLALCNDSADRKLREDILRFRRTFSPPPFSDSIILYKKIKRKR